MRVGNKVRGQHFQPVFAVLLVKRSVIQTAMSHPVTPDCALTSSSLHGSAEGLVTSSMIWCLFQRRSLVLSPTIPFKNFSSLHSMCMVFPQGLRKQKQETTCSRRGVLCKTGNRNRNNLWAWSPREAAGCQNFNKKNEMS